MGLSARDRRSLWLGASAYLLMTSRLLWVWEKRPRPPLELLGGNLYVWFSLALFAWMPIVLIRTDTAPAAVSALCRRGVSRG
jgi:alpha-1,2-mannosyltransferase